MLHLLLEQVQQVDQHLLQNEILGHQGGGVHARQAAKYG